MRESESHTARIRVRVAYGLYPTPTRIRGVGDSDSQMGRLKVAGSAYYAGCRCAAPRSQTTLPPATSASEWTRTSGEKYQFALTAERVTSTTT